MNFLLTDALCRQNQLKVSGWACLEEERWHFSSCWFEMMLQAEIKNSGWSLPVFKNDIMSSLCLGKYVLKMHNINICSAKI